MDQDVELSIALAEYEHLRDARRSVEEQSATRFNFFVVLASGAAVATAGVLASGAALTDARLAAVGGVGGMVLLLGLTIFTRQVEFLGRVRRYSTAADAIRTYLVRRAPQLAPYVLMPTLDDRGMFAVPEFRRRWLRDAISLAGTVGLVNSALCALGVGIALSSVGTPGWAVGVVGTLTLVGAVVAHVTYVRRRTTTVFGQVAEMVQRRPLHRNSIE